MQKLQGLLQSPVVENFQDSQHFFTDFLTLNSDVSHRNLGLLLDWPSSLISDIAQGRRGLSIARSLEFAKKFNYSGIQTERLLMLALNDVENTEVKRYSKEKLKHINRSIPSTTDELKSPESLLQYQDPKDMIDLALSSLSLFLEWCQGKTTPEEIGDLLYLTPELKNREVLEKKMNALRATGQIEGDFPNLKVNAVNSGSAAMTKEQLMVTLKALEPVVKENKPVLWRTDKYLITKAHFTELHERITSIYQWLVYSCLDPVVLNSRREELTLIQTHFLVTPLLDLEKMGLSLKRNSVGSMEVTSKATTPFQARDIQERKA